MKEPKIENYIKLLSRYGRGKKLLDIATGHGKYAVCAALLGYDVTAFDARTERMPEYYPMITWLKANLKAFDYFGYDVINCLGIFYHLPLPEQYILLKKINYTRVILDTHFVTDAAAAKWGLVSIDGYNGIECKEGDDLTTLKTKLKNAYDDLKNFCHTLVSLETILTNFGFRILETVPVTGDRKFFVLEPRK